MATRLPILCLLLIILLVVPSLVHAQGDVSLTITNSTDADVCTVAGSITGSGEWAENLLEDILTSGESVTFTEVEPESYDFIARDCANAIIDVAYGSVFESGDYTWDIVGFDTALDPLPAPPPTSPDQTWLVMLYIDADDEPLEPAMMFNVDEFELAGSADQVHIVAQVDRFDGGYNGHGDWTTTKRFYITRDTTIGAISSVEVMDLGEANMADGNTLVDFVSWAVANYPADKYVLILSDHGSGWPGGWLDSSVPGDTITLLELDQALATIQNQTALSEFEVIGFEACLMSTIEVYATLAPYARYAVASEEVIRDFGWAYAGFLIDLVTNPGMSGADLAQSIVRHFVDSDMLIDVTPEERLNQIRRELTITAVDLAGIPNLLAALDEMVMAASEIDQGAVAQARFYAQSYTSIFGNAVPPSYLDLGHLATMLAYEGGSRASFQAAARLSAALGQAIIAERHGPGLPGSTGMTIYFPNSTLYGIPDLPGSRAYTGIAGRFASQSLWDDFLLAHYTDATMPEPGAGTEAYAAEDATIVGPGVGTIVIAPIQASSEVFSMDEPLFLSTEITGGHVAMIRFFAAYFVDERDAWLMNSDVVLPADVDKEVNGVVYPNWGAQTVEGVLSVAGDFWPEDLVITDGVAYIRPLFISEGYDQNAVTYGTHVSAATGESRRARIRFNVDSTALIDVFVFSQEGGALVPYEISLEPGDQFIAENTWIDPATGDASFSAGEVFTFGDGDVWLDTVPSLPGDYIVGIMAVDLDGNPYVQTIRLTVEATE